MLAKVESHGVGRERVELGCWSLLSSPLPAWSPVLLAWEAQPGPLHWEGVSIGPLLGSLLICYFMLHLPKEDVTVKHAWSFLSWATRFAPECFVPSCWPRAWGFTFTFFLVWDIGWRGTSLCPLLSCLAGKLLQMFPMSSGVAASSANIELFSQRQSVPGDCSCTCFP